jgi:oligosaccharide repeat unit polymerase
MISYNAILIASIIMTIYSIIVIYNQCNKQLLLSSRSFFNVLIVLVYYASFIILYYKEPSIEENVIIVMLCVFYLHIATELIICWSKNKPPSLALKISNLFSGYKFSKYNIICAIIINTLVSIVLLYIYFSAFGGVSYYVNYVITKEVIGYSGYGWAKEIGILLLTTANYIYFTSVLKEKGLLYKLGFIVHLLVCIMLLMPFYGRANILNILLTLLIIKNYYSSRISNVKIIASLLILLTVAYFGVYMRYRPGSVKGGWEQAGEHFELAEALEARGGFGEYFDYTVEVFRLVPDPLEYKYGMTYLTFFTNLVPRKIWPGKFESAATFFSQVHQDIQYTGISQVPCTALGEAYLNFSYFGVILLPLFFAQFIKIVDWSAAINKTQAGIIMSAYLIRLIISLLIGDFSYDSINFNVAMGVIIMSFYLLIIFTQSHRRVNYKINLIKA